MSLAKTNFMKFRLYQSLLLLSWWQLLISFFIILLTFAIFTKFRVSVKVYFNMLTLTALIGIYLFKKTNIFALKIIGREDGLFFVNKKGTERKVVPHKMTENEKRVSNCLLYALKEKRAKLYFYGGVKDDEYQTSLLCGSVAAISSAASPVLKQEFGLSLTTNVLSTSKNDSLAASINLSLKTSIILLVVGLVRKRC